MKLKKHVKLDVFLWLTVKCNVCLFGLRAKEK